MTSAQNIKENTANLRRNYGQLTDAEPEALELGLCPAQSEVSAEK